MNGFVAVSQSIVEILKGCDFQNVFLCPPAVDVERFLRAGLDRVYSDVVRIGAVGRLVAEKNHRCFIEALNILKSSGYQFEAAIIGEGIEHDSLVRLKGQYQLKSLQITGFCDNVPAAMSQLDIVVLPSTAEAFGLVNVEAAACGCWVVAANLPGVRDFVQHGVTGFLFDPCSPEELARVLADLMEKRVPDTRASAKQKAQTYSPKYFAANVLRLFGSL